jgi:hypothetical protein
MADSFLTFQEFGTLEEAEQAGAILEEHNIPVVIEKPAELLDTLIIGQQYNNNYLLRIPGDCFVDAQRYLIEETRVDLDQVDPAYPLLSMSNKELMDVVSKPDQWGAYNYNLAKALLLKRDAPADAQAVETARATYIEELAKPRELNNTWYLLGYGFSALSIVATMAGNGRAMLMIYALQLFPGVLGLALGIVILTTRKTLPDGTHMLSYSKKARMHGALMLALAIIAYCLIPFMRFFADVAGRSPL